MFAGCPRVGGQQHAGSAARPVPLVVPAGLLAACEWGWLCQLHLGRGWRSSTSSLVVSVSACLEPSSIVFSPRTLFISSRKSPMTAQSCFTSGIHGPVTFSETVGLSYISGVYSGCRAHVQLGSQSWAEPSP